MVHCKRSQPCDAALGKRNERCTQRRARLAPDGGNSRHTRGIQEREDQKTQRGFCSKERRDGGGTQQNLKCADDGFLRNKAGDQRCRTAPVCEAQRREDRREPAADYGEQALLTAVYNIQPRVEALQEPDDDGCKENDCEGTLGYS